MPIVRQHVHGSYLQNRFILDVTNGQDEYVYKSLRYVSVKLQHFNNTSSSGTFVVVTVVGHSFVVWWLRGRPALTIYTRYYHTLQSPTHTYAGNPTFGSDIASSHEIFISYSETRHISMVAPEASRQIRLDVLDPHPRRVSFRYSTQKSACPCHNSSPIILSLCFRLFSKILSTSSSSNSLDNSDN